MLSRSPTDAGRFAPSDRSSTRPRSSRPSPTNHGAIGVNEIARRVGLDASSVSRIVRTLEIYRLLEREPATNRVTLGIGLVTLASDVLYGLDVRRLAAPELDRLSAATHETVNLGVWDGDGAAHRRPPAGRPADRRAGLDRPARPGSRHVARQGPARIPARSDPARDRRRAPEALHPDDDHASPAALEAALATIRAVGYAVNRGELRPELHAVAAPVFGLDDTVVAAIGVAGPSSRLTEARMAELADLVMSVGVGRVPSRSAAGRHPRAGHAGRPTMTAAIDPIRFEVVRNALTSATEEMAATIRRAAYSTNIKTRADFSCCFLDRQLRVVAQSFAQPIHLGNLSNLVPNAIRQYGAERLVDGDMIIVNDPYLANIHLNDITIFAPVVIDGELIGYLANLAHHVDVGGGAPASIAATREIFQEGVRIPPIRLVAGGEVVDDIFQLILAQIRSTRETTGDLRAQIAANVTGRRRIVELIESLGREEVERYVEELIDYTRRRTRHEIATLPRGVFTRRDAPRQRRLRRSAGPPRR